MRAAQDVLATEFTPLDDHRSGAAYRRDLVMSLFEKFFRGETSASQDTPSLRAGRLTCTLAAPRTTTRAARSRTRARSATSPAARSTSTTSRGGATCSKSGPSSTACARARHVDRLRPRRRSSPASAVVLTAKDVPGMNDVGAVRHDEPLFAASEVLFHGHVVALVVGTSAERVGAPPPR